MKNNVKKVKNRAINMQRTYICDTSLGSSNDVVRKKGNKSNIMCIHSSESKKKRTKRNRKKQKNNC